MPEKRGYVFLSFIVIKGLFGQTIFSHFLLTPRKHVWIHPIFCQKVKKTWEIGPTLFSLILFSNQKSLSTASEHIFLLPSENVLQPNPLRLSGVLSVAALNFSPQPSKHMISANSAVLSSAFSAMNLSPFSAISQIKAVLPFS